jgi:NTP pyrophosphatase (non-canonical NTP hydrolase)
MDQEQTEKIFRAIIKERLRQDILHPDNKPEDYLPILIEEIGEVARAMQGEGDIKEELIHVAASAVRWLSEL